MDKDDTVRDFIAGEIDCVDQSSTCQALLATHSWPTFTVFSNGSVSIVHPNRSIDGYSAKAEKTRPKYRAEPVCLSLVDDFTGDFPILLYTDVNQSGCSLARQIATPAQTANGRLFSDISNERTLAIVVLLASNRSPISHAIGFYRRWATSH
jgi:hypothetical protein